jgi:hypothetical protein
VSKVIPHRRTVDGDLYCGWRLVALRQGLDGPHVGVRTRTRCQCANLDDFFGGAQAIQAGNQLIM